MSIDTAHLNRISLESSVILKHKGIRRLKRFRIAAFWIKKRDILVSGVDLVFWPKWKFSPSRASLGVLALGDVTQHLWVHVLTWWRREIVLSNFRLFSSQILWFQITVAFKDDAAAWASCSSAGSFQRLVCAGPVVGKTGLEAVMW